MNTTVGSKNIVIQGLRAENARLVSEKAELKEQLAAAVEAELSTRENINAELHAVDILRERAHEAEKAAAEAQRDMAARPHRATVARCHEARRESDRYRTEQQLEFQGVRTHLHNEIRKLRSWTRSGSFVLAGLVFGFAIGVLVS